MDNRKNNVSIGISIIATILALAALCVAVAIKYPRAYVQFDYIGVIVAIFGVLVTLLIGWDIYKVFDTRRQVDDLRKKFEQLQDKVHEQMQTARNDHEKEMVKLLNTNYNTFKALAVTYKQLYTDYILRSHTDDLRNTNETTLKVDEQLFYCFIYCSLFAITQKLGSCKHSQEKVSLVELHEYVKKTMYWLEQIEFKEAKLKKDTYRIFVTGCQQYVADLPILRELLEKLGTMVSME